MTDALPPGPRDELIAPGDPVYARLADAARRGLLPGWQPVDFLRGDRLYTRRELAPLLDSLPRRAGGLVVLGNEPRALAAGRDWQVQATKAGVTAAELSKDWHGWAFSAGRRSLRWGPGWTGGLLFSDTAPPLDRISVTKNFGRLTFEQFYGQFFEADDPTAPPEARGTRRHLAGRRLTLHSNGPWELSAGEAIKTLRLPDPFFATTLPWYVYEHDWTSGGTGRWLGLPRSASYKSSHWLNYMGELSVSYHPQNGIRLYGEYLLDDIKAPTFLGGSETTPQRSGLLVGAAATRGPLSWRAELLDTNRRTYRSDIQADTWQRGDSPLGHAGGPNARLLFARTDYRVSPRLALALEAEQRRRRDTSQPGPTDRNRITLFASATLSPQAFTTTRLERDSAHLTLGWIL